MPASLVQKATASGADGYNSGAGFTVTLNGVSGRHFLTLQVSLGTLAVPGTPTDANGTWLAAGSGTGTEGVDDTAAMCFYQRGAAYGTHNATIVGSSGYGYIATLAEWSGMAPSSSVDVLPATITDFATSLTVPSQTLVQADELVLGTLTLGEGSGTAAAAITTPTNYTQLAVQNNTLTANGNIGGEHCYIGSAGSTALPSTTWTFASGNTYMVGWVVTFKIVPPPRAVVQICG